MKHPHDVIIRPVLTEASYAGIPEKRYAFVVDINANKTEVKLALEQIFKGHQGGKGQHRPHDRQDQAAGAAPRAARPRSRRRT